MFIFLIFIRREIWTIKVEQAVTQFITSNCFDFETKITNN